MAAELCIVLGRIAAAPRRRSGKPEPREAGGGIEAAAAESTRFPAGLVRWCRASDSARDLEEDFYAAARPR